MSTTELQAQVKELRELRRMAEELEAEIATIQDTIKAYMTAAGVDELTGADYKITWKPVQSKRFDKAAMVRAFGQECYDGFCKTTTAKRFAVV